MTGPGGTFCRARRSAGPAARPKRASAGQRRLRTTAQPVAWRGPSVRCDECGGGGRNSGDGGRGAAVEEAAVEEAAAKLGGDDRAAVIETRSRRRRHLSPATSVQIAVG